MSKRDTRLRCGTCNEFMPKNIANHACRAAFGTCRVCKKACASNSTIFCWVHNECMHFRCGTIMYKRLGYCKRHSCTWNERLATLSGKMQPTECSNGTYNGYLCHTHFMWLEMNATRLKLCRHCGTPNWYMMVPFWLVKEKLIIKDIACYMLRFVACCFNNPVTCKVRGEELKAFIEMCNRAGLIKKNV
jgi:hypothetical protein